MSEQVRQHYIERGSVGVVTTVTKTEEYSAMAKAWAHDGGVRLMVSSPDNGFQNPDRNARFIDLTNEQALHLAQMIQRATQPME